MKNTRRILKAVLPTAAMDSVRYINRHYLMRFSNVSYSQEGEDILLSKIFLDQHKGFYVDIGAHHPVTASNTYLFYRRGWRGINVEPVPGAKKMFKRVRPRDVTLEVGVSDVSGVLPFYVFDHPVHNTFSEKERDVTIKDGKKLIRTIPVPVERLDSILEGQLPDGAVIDFMSIDVEGHEEAVLASNDWNRFRPNILCIEMLMVRATEIVDQPVAAYLRERGYHFIAKLDNSVFFQEKDFCFCDRDFEEGPRKAELAMATVFDNGEKPRLSASNLSYGDGLQQYHERARSFSDRAGIE